MPLQEHLGRTQQPLHIDVTKQTMVTYLGVRSHKRRKKKNRQQGGQPGETGLPPNEQLRTEIKPSGGSYRRSESVGRELSQNAGKKSTCQEPMGVVDTGETRVMDADHSRSHTNHCIETHNCLCPPKVPAA
jgi:ribosomal protein S8E